jgi:hypothetical protein
MTGEIDLAGQLGFGDKLTAEVRLNDFSKEKLNHGTEINHMLQPYLVTVLTGLPVQPQLT